MLVVVTVGAPTTSCNRRPKVVVNVIVDVVSVLVVLVVVVGHGIVGTGVAGLDGPPSHSGT